MALTDIVLTSPTVMRETRGNTAIKDIVYTSPTIAFESRGNVGVLKDMTVAQQNIYVPMVRSSWIAPAQTDVRIGVGYGVNGVQYTGSLIVGGTAAYAATVTKEVGANAHGGSGTCAKFDPSSATSPGYWYFYVPASTSFVLTFWHKITTGWNGTLAVSIYDIDQATVLISSASVTLVNDGAYHMFTCPSATPSATGLCLVRMEIQDGSTTGWCYIDDIGIT